MGTRVIVRCEAGVFGVLAQPIAGRWGWVAVRGGECVGTGTAATRRAALARAIGAVARAAGEQAGD